LQEPIRQTCTEQCRSMTASSARCSAMYWARSKWACRTESKTPISFRLKSDRMLFLQRILVSLTTPSSGRQGSI